MRKTVDELAVQAGRRLTELGYKDSTIRCYTTTWNKVRRWCADRDIECFGADQERRIAGDWGLDGDDISPAGRSTLRQVRTLLSVDRVGSLPALSRSAPGSVPDRFWSAFEAYGSYLERRRLARATRSGQLSVIRKFMTGLSISELGDLSADDVAAHMGACSGMTAQTRAGILYTIRAFARWAAGEGLCSPAVAAALLVIPGHKHASLPSAYAAGEVAAMIAATGTECPRRDRAMLLMASVLGLRAGDISGHCA